MANFLNYIVESSIQPVKTNVLWIKNGVPYYFNKKWKPLLGSGSGGGSGESVDSPIQFGEGEYSAVLKNSNSRALNDYALALGYNTVSNNPSETAFGKFNKSISSSDFSKATLFSIGNGTTNLLKNAFEVKFDGSIYIEGVDITLQKYLENLTNEDLQFYSEITRIDDELKVIKDSIDIAVGEGFSEFIEQFENSIKRIEVLEDKTVENSTKITQSAEEIQSVATRVTVTEESLVQQESKITQTAENITSEVSRIETKYDNELKTVKESTSSIDQKADSINLRVEGLEGTLNSKTSELEGKITKNTSEIALNKEQIGLKVNTDVFDELAGTVEQQGASIEINTNSIKNKVEQSSFNAFTGEVNNQFTEVNQSIEGITTTVQDNTGKITVIEETVDGLTSKTGTLEAEIDSLKKQSDGSIDTHFGTTAPTLNNEPAVNWDTDELKKEHTGDIYYNNNTGEAYRFSYDPQTNTYFWVELTDSALTDALDKISKLEEAIDGKVTIFYTQPSNYKYGDIWFVHNSNYSPYKEGSLLTATNLAKDAVVESFNLNHWVLKADIVKSLNDLDKTVTDAFKDNIITIAEVDTIKESKKSFESSFQELTSAHAIVIATTLGNSAKLKTAYSNLENKYNAFIQSIDSLVLDSNGNLSDVLLQAYTTAYNDYVEALKNYSKAKEELTDSIQKELSSANDYIKDISSDGVITPVEKKNLIEIWRSIAEEFNSNKGIAVNYKIIDSEGNERTDIYSDGIYYSNYALYEAAFDEIKTIFTSDVFGISNTTTSTTLPEGYSINDIDSALNNYYDTLSVFAEMISKITIEITDAHEKVLQLSKELQEQLSPSDNITQIGKGVILSSIIGVQSNGVLQAGLNATNINGLVDTSKDNHGRIVFAGGINGAPDWNTANTVIYEDGYVHFKWGEIDEGVEIGNALIRSVVSGSIDLFSYPENGTLVPLFIVNKDNTGKIVSISTPYDFIANKNLIVHGDTSSGGEGGSSSVGIQGIKLNGTTYRDENSDGIIDLGTIGGGTLTEITYEMIVEALGYTPVSSASLGSLAYANGVTWAQVSGLLAGGDEFNIVPSGHNGVFSFNHRAKDGGSATITEYRMRNGGGSYAPVRASSFIAHGGTSSQFLKADGSLDGTSYLSTSGGTISGASGNYTPLIVKTTSLSEVWIAFEDTVGVTHIGSARGVPSINLGGDNKTIIHSGNIGDYAATRKLRQSTIDLNTVSNGFYEVGYSGQEISNRPSGTSNGLFMDFRDANGYAKIQFYGNNATNGLYFRTEQGGASSVGSAWKTIAFTSDLENYLPLSGGTLTGDIVTTGDITTKSFWTGTDGSGLYIEGKSNVGIRIQYNKSATGWDYDQLKLTNGVISWNDNTLLHSGNIDSYNAGGIIGKLWSAKTTPNLLTVWHDWDNEAEIGYSSYSYGLHSVSKDANYQFLLGAGALIDGLFFKRKTTDGWGNWKTIAFTDSDITGNAATATKATKDGNGNIITSTYLPLLGGTIKGSSTSTPLFIVGGSTQVRLALGYGDSPLFAYLVYKGGFNWCVTNESYGGEKTIAFTDSNVASAQALKHSNGTVGATAYADGKVYFENGVLLKNNSGGVFSFDKDGGYRKILFLGSDNNMYVGFNTQSDQMRIYGSPISFFIGGTDAMRINSSGNVTIGASDLAGTNFKLMVDGLLGMMNGTSYSGILGFSDNTLYLGYSGVTHNTCVNGREISIKTSADGYTRLHVNKNGNVTIGDSDLASVGYKLFVDGILGIGGSGNSQWVTRFVSNSEIGLDIQLGRNANNDKLPFSIAWRNDLVTPPFTINPSGNVLIGTTTDNGAKLQVANNDNDVSQMSFTNNAMTGFVGVDDGGLFMYHHTNKDIRFHTYGDERMRITSGGNVLIGTTSDEGYKLDVNGLLKAAAANFGGDAGINIGMTYLHSTSGAYDLIERKYSGGTLYFQFNHNGGVNLCNGGGGVDMGGALSVKGAVTMASTLSVSGVASFGNYMSLPNNTGIYFYDASGTIRSQFYVDPNNDTSIGYGAAVTGGNTRVYGKEVVIGTGTSRVDRLIVSDSGAIIKGNLVVQGDISA